MEKSSPRIGPPGSATLFSARHAATSSTAIPITAVPQPPTLASAPTTGRRKTSGQCIRPPGHRRPPTGSRHRSSLRWRAPRDRLHVATESRASKGSLRAERSTRRVISSHRIRVFEFIFFTGPLFESLHSKKKTQKNKLFLCFRLKSYFFADCF